MSCEEKNRIECDLKEEATWWVCHRRFLDKLTFGWDPSKEEALCDDCEKNILRRKHSDLKRPWAVWGITGCQCGLKVVDGQKSRVPTSMMIGKRRQSQTIDHAKGLDIRKHTIGKPLEGEWCHLANVYKTSLRLPSEEGTVGKARMEARTEDTRRGSSLKPRGERVSRRRECSVLPKVADRPSKIKTKNRPLALAGIRSLVTPVRAV